MIKEIRKLNTGDLFEFMRMVKRTGVKEELKKATKGEKNEKDPLNNEKAQIETGMDLAFSIFEIFSNEKSEDEIFKFLARPFQCTPKDVQENDLTDTVEKILEIADIQKWKSFFKLATQ